MVPQRFWVFSSAWAVGKTAVNKPMNYHERWTEPSFVVAHQHLVLLFPNSISMNNMIQKICRITKQCKKSHIFQKWIQICICSYQIWWSSEPFFRWLWELKCCEFIHTHLRVNCCFFYFLRIFVSKHPEKSKMID